MECPQTNCLHIQISQLGIICVIVEQINQTVRQRFEMGSLIAKVTPGSTLVTFGHPTPDNPDDLPVKLVIDKSNVIICQAAANPSGDTVIALVTHNNALTRQLNVTSNSAFARTILCGKRYGTPMKTPNQDMKMTAVNFGKDAVIAVQFLKQMQPDRICCPIKPTDFGTMLIPHALKGHLIVFMWPEDYPGHGWDNFVRNDTNYDGKESTTQAVEVPECALKVDEDAERLRHVFNL